MTREELEIIAMDFLNVPEQYLFKDDIPEVDGHKCSMIDWMLDLSEYDAIVEAFIAGAKYAIDNL